MHLESKYDGNSCIYQILVKSDEGNVLFMWQNCGEYNGETNYFITSEDGSLVLHHVGGEYRWVDYSVIPDDDEVDYDWEDENPREDQSGVDLLFTTVWIVNEYLPNAKNTILAPFVGGAE